MITTTNIAYYGVDCVMRDLNVGPIGQPGSNISLRSRCSQKVEKDFMIYFFNFKNVYFIS